MSYSILKYNIHTQMYVSKMHDIGMGISLCLSPCFSLSPSPNTPLSLPPFISSLRGHVCSGYGRQRSTFGNLCTVFYNSIGPRGPTQVAWIPFRQSKPSQCWCFLPFPAFFIIYCVYSQWDYLSFITDFSS